MGRTRLQCTLGAEWSLGAKPVESRSERKALLINYPEGEGLARDALSWPGWR
jgi:hypothetical protein